NEARQSVREVASRKRLPLSDLCDLPHERNRHAGSDARCGRPHQLDPSSGDLDPTGNYGDRREALRQVWSSLHSQQIVERFFTSMDQGINLYNDKFGKPAKGAMDKLLAMKKITPTPYDEKIEWVFYELWHHEGRRARHGLSKVAPDY